MDPNGHQDIIDINTSHQGMQLQMKMKSFRFEIDIISITFFKQIRLLKIRNIESNAFSNKLAGFYQGHYNLD